MKRLVLLAVVVATGFSIAFSQAGEHPVDKTDSDDKYLVKAEHKIADAFVEGDLAFLESLLAADFIGFNPLGEELNKVQVLARVTSPDFELESLRHEDVRVRVFGEAAVATGLTVVKGRYKGQDAGGRFRYLRVWIRREGRWQAVAGQSTPVPQPIDSTPASPARRDVR